MWFGDGPPHECSQGHGFVLPVSTECEIRVLWRTCLCFAAEIEGAFGVADTTHARTHSTTRHKYSTQMHMHARKYTKSPQKHLHSSVHEFSVFSPSPSPEFFVCTPPSLSGRELPLFTQKLLSSMDTSSVCLCACMCVMLLPTWQAVLRQKCTSACEDALECV